MPTAAIAGAEARASSTIPAIASAVRLIAASEIPPVSSRAFAETRHLGAVDDRIATFRRDRSPTWNFTEFVPTSITAYRGGTSSRSAVEPAQIARVQVAVESDARTASRTARRVLGLDRDGLRRRPSAVTSVISPMQPPIVKRVRRLWTFASRTAPLGDELVEEFVERPASRVSGRRGTPEGLEDLVSRRPRAGRPASSRAPIVPGRRGRPRAAP